MSLEKLSPGTSKKRLWEDLSLMQRECLLVIVLVLVMSDSTWHVHSGGNGAHLHQTHLAYQVI